MFACSFLTVFNIMAIKKVFNFCILIIFGLTCVFAPEKKSKSSTDTNSCLGTSYNSICYWVEILPTDKNSVNCSTGELAWVTDNETWQYITTELDTELRNYHAVNLGLYSSPPSTAIINTSANLDTWYNIYGKVLLWVHSTLKWVDDKKSCVLLQPDVWKAESCKKGNPGLCEREVNEQDDECPDKIIFNKCYWYTAEKLIGIYSIQNECSRQNGTLAVPENVTVSKELVKSFPNKAYIGVTSLLWRDIYTGSIIQWHNWNTDGDLKNPCAVMSSTFEWQTKDCTSFFSYPALCMKVAPQFDECSTVPMRNASYYWLSNKVNSIAQAQKACEDGGGHLTYPKNREELDFLKTNITISSSKCWIGISTNHRKWYNTREEQTWFNWENPYSSDDCVTFNSDTNYRWSINCSIGQSTSTSKRGPGESKTDSSIGNLCMKTEYDTSITPTTQLTSTVAKITEHFTTEQVTTEGRPSTEQTAGVWLSSGPSNTNDDDNSEENENENDSMSSSRTPLPDTSIPLNEATNTIEITKPLTQSTSLPGPSTFKPIVFTEKILLKDKKCQKQILDTKTKKLWTFNCLCSCHKCNKAKHVEITKERLEKLQEKTKKRLVLPRKNISAVKNKKISKPDSRPSSSTIGSFFILTIIGVLMFLITADVVMICNNIRLRLNSF